MPNEPPDRREVTALRSLMEAFFLQRLTPKQEALDKAIAKESDPEKHQTLQGKRQALIEEYQREPWLESAAKRVGQIQLVTHALKFTHPNARGSSIHLSTPLLNPDTTHIGTHTLGGARLDDVVGNAAALDVYKLLTLEHEGEPLLRRITHRDPALRAAMSDDPQRAEQWMERFAAVTRGDETPASHRLAKQLYFPLQGGGYHLLAPLFPTSLVHDVHQRLRDAQFSDATKEARQAEHDKKPWPHGYHRFPNLAAQLYGGTKPQNISQLNSQRYGENWLLPACPPSWHGVKLRPPLGTKSVFKRGFGNRAPVREVSKGLALFLASTDYNNVKIRDTRAEMVERLCDELIQFAAELSELSPGWSTDEACKLDRDETLWLDPGRAETDEPFAAERRRGDWHAAIADRFAAWLNQQLREIGSLPVGDVERREWRRLAKQEIEEALRHE